MLQHILPSWWPRFVGHQEFSTARDMKTGRLLCRTLQDYCKGRTYHVLSRATGQHGHPQHFPHQFVETLSTAVQQFPTATSTAHHCRQRAGVGDRSNQEPPDSLGQAVVFSIMGWSRQLRGPVDVGVWARECQTTSFWLPAYLEQHFSIQGWE